MKKIDIQWLMPVALFSSDRLFQYQLKLLSDKPIKEDPELYIEELKLAMQDYQPYLTTQLRDEDLSYAIEEWQENGKIDPEGILQRLLDTFLLWRGDHFEVKAENLETWLAVLSLIDPVWIIGFGYSQLLKNRILTVNQGINLISQQCLSGLPKRFDGCPIADNHVHMNGHGHNGLSLIDFSLYLKKRSKKSQKKKINWPRRAECTLLNSGMLDKKEIPERFNQLCTSLGLSILESKKCNEIILEEPIKLEQELVSAIISGNTFSESSQLLIASSHKRTDMEHGRWLLLVSGLLLGLATELNHSVISLAFIQVSHLLRNHMIVSGIGLSQFVDYFNHKDRAPRSSDRGFDSNKHAIGHDLQSYTFREFRVGSNIIPPVKPKKTQSLLGDFANTLIQRNAHNQCHFVIHFLRRFESNDLHYDKAQEEKRKALLKEVRKIQDFFASAHYSCISSSSDLSYEQPKQGFSLPQLVRGFDVAGNENELRIEVFAPALRVLRSGLHASTSDFTQRLRQPFITVHAGEDYSHLLSGLRAVDEAIEFCQMTNGDRLGHALAIGVDVTKWAKRQQRIYIPAGEYLDNLVWCYEQALRIIQVSSDFSGLLPLLENKIQRWSEHIYQEQPSPRVLYRAWLLRRNCPIMSILPSQAYGTEWASWVPDMRTIEQKGHDVIYWKKYLNTRTKDSKYFDIVNVSCNQYCGQGSDNDKHLRDYISHQELNLYSAIQDLLIEKCNKKQLVIEACPTSNIYIGRFKYYSEHPIFRWYSPKREWLDKGQKFNKFGLRTGPLKVCVNTDDAGLMPTTIENEHRILKETAVNIYDVSTLEAELWIDDIRKIGVDTFKSNHLDWVS